MGPSTPRADDAAGLPPAPRSAGGSGPVVDAASLTPTAPDGGYGGGDVQGPAYDIGGTDPYEPDDTPAEVDAAFRAQRRIAISYFVLVMVLVGAVPVLNDLVAWWSQGRLIGGLSPSFAVIALGMYVALAVLGFLAARVADAVEQRMLGGRAALMDDEELDGP